MTEICYRADHSTFGGLIYPSDFNTDHRGKQTKNGSAIARRIVSDQKFDLQCRKNDDHKTKEEVIWLG
ncbi:MAG: hypothetical protein NC543_13625 [bacterium]|nr:hypothetical protein [bacterium]